MELYRPIGGDWFLEGFWRIAEPYNNHWVTVNQYLSLHQDGIPDEPTYRINKVDQVENGIYNIGYQRAIELQTFKKMKFDYIVPSIPKHYREYTRLRNMYQPQAKVICQVGNSFDFPWEWTQNIMSSSKYTSIPSNKNVVFYHQEFPLDIFSFQQFRNTKVISSFLHLFSRRKDYPLWLEMQRVWNDFTFNTYGSEGREEYLTTDQALAEAMHNSDLIVHLKEEGDGFGHVIHNAFAVGRAVVTKKEYYTGKMAFDLMEDERTCFFWHEDKSSQWNIDRINSFNWADIGVNAHNRFNDVVNYEKEEKDVRRFLDRST